jgi:hypothetical protein
MDGVLLDLVACLLTSNENRLAIPSMPLRFGSCLWTKRVRTLQSRAAASRHLACITDGYPLS